MYRVIKSASYMGYRYRYEVHWMTTKGEDKLLGASNSLDTAEEIALNQVDRIFKSPWETDKNKFLFLKNCYIFDVETEEDVTTAEVEDRIDALMSELDGRIKARVSRN